jgi:pSer/pThr/pTyr-binding forkhead associated (FHA) protein
MQGPELFTIFIVVGVILFVGIILAFVFTTRSSKIKKSEQENDQKEGGIHSSEEIRPKSSSGSQKTKGVKVKGSESDNTKLQLVLDDDRILNLTLPSTLGRIPDNNIEISDPTVSARHAKIYFDPRAQAVCIEDLDSTNGIFIDGRPTRKSILDDGARLTIGDVSLTFRNKGYLPPSS